MAAAIMLSQASRAALRPASIRFASTAVKQEALSRASGLSGTYASSAYQAACRKGDSSLQTFESDLRSISDALKQSPELREFVTNPTLSTSDKQKGLDALLSTTQGGGKGGKDSITRNFFEALIENGRLTDLEQILSQFKDIMAAHRGEVNITVTSAAQLDNGTRSSLEKALRGSETVKKAQNAKFSYVVNEGIIGGLIVDIGGERSIDLSTSHRVNKINAQLNQSV